MSRRYSSPKGPSQRQLRAGELVRHALVEIFHREDLRDPALHGLSITLTEVRMTPDLKQATVFSAPLGASIDRDKHPAIIKALNHAAPHLRHRLAQGRARSRARPRWMNTRRPSPTSPAHRLCARPIRAGAFIPAGGHEQAAAQKGPAGFRLDHPRQTL